jgi:hypothetical protein
MGREFWMLLISVFILAPSLRAFCLSSVIDGSDDCPAAIVDGDMLHNDALLAA